MSKRLTLGSFTYLKEPWQIQFENEPINDERWECIVAAAVETKVEDEECIRIFNNYVVSGENEVVRVITPADVSKAFKNDKISQSNKSKVDVKEDRSNRERTKDSRNGETNVPITRFPEMFALISKYTSQMDGSGRFPPELMAYALKYLILEMKDKDCRRRRAEITSKRKRRESELKAQIIKKIHPISAESEEQTDAEADDEVSRVTDPAAIKRKNLYDIFVTDSAAPYNGPEMYVMLTGFYNPLYFYHLQKIRVPFAALMRVEDPKPQVWRAGRTPSATGTKKSEILSSFWEYLMDQVTNEESTVLYKDMAFLKYCVPHFNENTTLELQRDAVASDLSQMLYTAYHISRLHERYIHQMKVHRMIQALEPLDLSRCEVYNTLCDILVTDDFKAGILVLFAVIEQVVAGVPDTSSKIIEYTRKTKNFPVGSTLADSSGACNSEEAQGDPYGKSRAEDWDATVSSGRSECFFSPSYLKDILEKKPRTSAKTSDEKWRSPSIYLYGDELSLRIHCMDHRILKPSALFERFFINSAARMVSKRFPNLTTAERCGNEFQFFRLWERSKESEESLKIKLMFSIAMKLIESTRSGTDEQIELASAVTGGILEEDKPIVWSNPKDYGPCESFFQPALNLLYEHQTRDVALNDNDFSNSTIRLRKAVAYSILGHSESSTLENLEVACGRKCPTIDSSDCFTKENQRIPLALQQFLDSFEISSLTVPCPLVNQKEFEEFLGQHNFYETLEPNRTWQRLQYIHDNFNSVECTYFSPTDTVFVLGQNSTDSRGVSRHEDNGFVSSPLSLRDFFRYVLLKNKKWMSQENDEYLKFLNDIREDAEREAQRRDHECKCCFLNMYYSMSKLQRRRLLEALEESETALDEKATEKKGRRKGDESSHEAGGSMASEELDDLPIKKKPPPSEKVSFYGINFKDIITQVQDMGKEFHSNDGTIVSIRSQSWLYGSCMETLTIRRLGSIFYLHTWNEEGIVRKSYRFVDPSQISVSFHEKKEKGEDEGFNLSCRILWPVGLLIESIPVDDGTFYVKQSYIDGYRIGKDIDNEKSRCSLSNGQILIFRTDGSVKILCPSGTIYNCYRFALKKKRKPCNPSRGGTVKTKWEVVIYDALESTGEFWVRDECLQCKRLMKTLTVLTGVDPKTKEVYCRREDGTNRMLWPDGKLVTIYPDGTKITSTPDFEEKEIDIELDGDDIIPEERPKQKQPPELGQSSNSEVTVMTGEHESENSFVSITCSYSQEHPNYATCNWKDGQVDLKMPGNMQVKVTENGSYRISSHNSILETLNDTILYYNKCESCGKKSISTIYLNAGSDPDDILSKTEDYHGHNFTVFPKNKVAHDVSEEVFGGECTEQMTPPSSNTSQQSLPRECQRYCQHGGKNRTPEKCVVVNRDLTGLEFINDKALSRYTNSLSVDAYYDMGRLSECSGIEQHSFLNPLYKINEDHYIMTYECNDALPTNIKRKDLVPMSEAESPSVSNCRHTFHVSDDDDERRTTAGAQQQPKAVAVRFLKVLHPDPSSIIKQIRNLIMLYQKKAFETSTAYSNMSNKRVQLPFTEHVAKELKLIASSLCPSMNLYPHTCTTIPYTEQDIHSIAHNLDLNEYFAEVSPSNLQTSALPECKQIPKPLRYKSRKKVIQEVSPKSNT